MPRLPRPRLLRRALALVLALCGLLLGELTGHLPAAQAAGLTTLFSTINGSPTVTGVNSMPVGPTDIGTFRQAMAFTPTTSGSAQLLSMRGQCVGLSCGEIGRVSIQSDDNGKPSGVDLGTMGFYVFEDVPNLWRISETGHPTGGTFRLQYTDGTTVKTTDPIPYNTFIRCCVHGIPPDVSIEERVQAAGFPSPQLSPGDQDFPGQFVRLDLFDAQMTLGGTGTVSAVDVQLTGGTSPGISIESPHVEKECGSLSSAPMLTAGTKYWAVMSSPGEIGWNYWSDDPGQVMESTDDGPWVAKPDAKTPALRIDSGATACQPVAKPNPDPGTKLADLVTTPGVSAWSTATMANTGVAPLTLGKARFTGPGASAFSLLDQEPGVLAKPYKLPKSIGVDGLSILYVACNSQQQGYYDSTLVIDTSDPDQPTISYPVTCLVDNTPPTVQFPGDAPDGSNGWWRTSPVDLHIRADDPESGDRVSSVVCSDDNPGGMNPQSVSGRQLTSTLSGQGVHQIDCAATDQAGNHAGGFKTTVKVDSTAPTTTLDSAPAGATTSTSATMTFTGSDDRSGVAGFECSLDSAAYASCASGRTYDDLAEGPHTVRVRTVDQAGNVDASPEEAAWTVDTGAPTTQITAKPPAITDQTTAVFSFDGSDTGTSVSYFECSLDGAPYAHCPAGDSFSGLAQGPHTLSVRAVDAAGNRDGSPPSWDWTVDVTAPTTSITAAPPTRTSQRSATFAFTSDDAGGGSVARQECSLDDAAYATCTSPQTFTGLGLGEHTFAVRAVDTAGNVEDAVTRSWSVLDFFVEDDAARTSEDKPVTIDVSGHIVAAEGTVVSLHPERSAAGGTVVAFGDRLRYTPPADFHGTDTFTYTASDGSTTTEPATVTVRVLSVDDAPRLELGRPFRAGHGLVRMTVRLSDVDSRALKLATTMSGAGLDATASGSGHRRTVVLRGLADGASGRLVLRVSDGHAHTTTALKVQVGTAAADTITGTPGADLIITRGGGDRVRSLAGADFILGGAGDDHLSGGAGNDVLHGRGGDDVLRGGAGQDILRGGPGHDVLIGGPGSDGTTGHRW